jgi:hypothetical protein
MIVYNYDHNSVNRNITLSKDVGLQSLVSSMVIDVELGREDYGLIPHNCDRKGVGTT